MRDPNHLNFLEQTIFFSKATELNSENKEIILNSAKLFELQKVQTILFSKGMDLNSENCFWVLNSVLGPNNSFFKTGEFVEQ